MVTEQPFWLPSLTESGGASSRGECARAWAKAAWHGQPLPLRRLPIVAGRRDQLGRDRRGRPLPYLPPPAESWRYRREESRNVKSSIHDVHLSRHLSPEQADPEDPEDMGRPVPRTRPSPSRICRDPKAVHKATSVHRIWDTVCGISVPGTRACYCGGDPEPDSGEPS